MAKFDNVNKDAALVSAGAGGLYYIKETLKAAGWAVVSSSDGTTYSAVGDVITTFATGAGGMDNPYAWFRIQDPGGLRELVFQRATFGALIGNSWRVKYSASAKFTGGAPAATVVPSATDEQLLCGSGTDGAPGFTSILATGDSYYMHCVAQSTPENGVYGFWFFATVKGSGVISGQVMCEPLDSATYPVEDVEPCLFVCTNAATRSVMSGVWAGWYAKGLGAQAWLTATTGWSMAPPFSSSYTNLFGTNPVGANPYTGEDDNIAAGVMRASAVIQPGWRGYTKYLKIRGSLRSYPSTANLATDAYVYFGEFLVPWPNGIAPTL
jgi:hypothetical protein